MNPRHDRDAIDELIDGVIAESLSGEPRITGESVRAAAASRRKSWMPVWAAAAAILMVGLAIGRRSNDAVGPAETASASARPSITPSPATDPIGPASEPSSMFRGVVGTAHASRGTLEKTVEPYAALPRLEIAPIEAPDPLTTGAIAAANLIIPRIEITPLSMLDPANGSGGENQGDPQ